MGDGNIVFHMKKKHEWYIIWNDLWNISEAYSQPCQTSKIEVFTKTVNKLKLLFILAKNSILGVWQGSKYTSAFMLELFFKLLLMVCQGVFRT